MVNNLGENKDQVRVYTTVIKGPENHPPTKALFEEAKYILSKNSVKLNQIEIDAINKNNKLIFHYEENGAQKKMAIHCSNLKGLTPAEVTKYIKSDLSGTGAIRQKLDLDTLRAEVLGNAKRSVTKTSHGVIPNKVEMLLSNALSFSHIKGNVKSAYYKHKIAQQNKTQAASTANLGTIKPLFSNDTLNKATASLAKLHISNKQEETTPLNPMKDPFADLVAAHEALYSDKTPSEAASPLTPFDMKDPFADLVGENHHSNSDKATLSDMAAFNDQIIAQARKYVEEQRSKRQAEE